MKTLILTTTDDQDYELVVKLAQRLGLEYHEEPLTAPAAEAAELRPLPDVRHLSREELLAIIDHGGDGKSISDPLAWQRAERDWDARLAFPQP